jgi:hypothetical protein
MDHGRRWVCHTKGVVAEGNEPIAMQIGLFLLADFDPSRISMIQMLTPSPIHMIGVDERRLRFDG